MPSVNGENNPPNANGEQSWILFISGPTGSGKSSVAEFLASNLKARFIEGDDVRAFGRTPNTIL
jgi:gluconokinase